LGKCGDCGDFDSVFDFGVDIMTGNYFGDVPMNPAPNRFSDFSPRPVVDSANRFSGLWYI